MREDRNPQVDSNTPHRLTLGFWQHIPNSGCRSVLPLFWTRSLSQCKAPHFGHLCSILPRSCLAAGSTYGCRASGITAWACRSPENMSNLSAGHIFEGEQPYLGRLRRLSLSSVEHAGIFYIHM